jgi:flagellar FliJ protein
MVPSKRLKPVQRVAETRERTAAKELGDSRRHMRAQEERLDELHRYHREYLERFHVSAQSGMTATQLQEYRAFLTKLERAIREQESVVAESRNQCSQHQENWQQKHVRTQALGKVMERYQREERKQEDVREQKESDERSQHRKH